MFFLQIEPDSPPIRRRRRRNSEEERGEERNEKVNNSFFPPKKKIQNKTQNLKVFSCKKSKKIIYINIFSLHVLYSFVCS